MAGGTQPRKNDKPSIKYRCNTNDGGFFELPEFVPEDYATSSSSNGKQHCKKPETKSPDILSTAQLISTVCQIWDFATSPLSVLHTKKSSEYDYGDHKKGNVFLFPADEGKITASTSTKGQHFSVNFLTTSSKINLDCLDVAQKLSFFECCSDSLTRSLFQGGLHIGSVMPIQHCKEKGLSSLVILYDLQNIYGWMSRIRPVGLKHQVNTTWMSNKKTDECYSIGEATSPASCYVSVQSVSPDNNLITGISDYHTEKTKNLEISSGQNENEKYIMKTNAAIMSLCSDSFLEPVQNIEGDGSASMTPTPSLQADCCISVVASHKSSFAESQPSSEDDLHESENNQQRQCLVEKSEVETLSSTQCKPRYAIAKQEHAFAGAFAGIVVSLCLHPVDTVKTVIQSCRTDQKSIHHISKSIISERGLSGLYRGITSNIASSAPISAVYTFTYESVKGALLPLLAKEYHSLAHCTAGGCASIATSFIFTPSERIKQQMQVGSHYHNCWNALFGIVRKGGFSSLYAGWGAVLCRNVPHSVIKFYTYESLKHLMLFSLQSNAQPTTMSTLVCGGLAGSTAALFTTPFDVVKTRLQTQIPGSVNRYDGVFDTLKEIAKHEGLKGLYRGLTPRLAMYMTQGALFFASYESFKRLLALKAPQLNAPSNPV